MNFDIDTAPSGASGFGALEIAREAALDPSPGRLKRYTAYARQAGLSAAPYSGVDAAMDSHQWGVAYPDDRASPAAIRAARVADERTRNAYRAGQIERARTAVAEHFADNLDPDELRDCYYREALIGHGAIAAARATHAQDGPESTHITPDDIVDIIADFVEVDDRQDAVWEAECALRDFHVGWRDATPEEDREAAEAEAEVEACFGAGAVFAAMPSDADFADALRNAHPHLTEASAAEVASRTIRRLRQPPVRQFVSAGDPDPFAGSWQEPDANLHEKALKVGNLSFLGLATNAGEIVPWTGETEEPATDLAADVLMLEHRAMEAGDLLLSQALKRHRVGMGAVARDNVAPPPVDLWQRHEAPDLPAGLLPNVIEDFARRQGEVMGADPAGLAMSALAVCGAAINDAIEVQVKEHDPSWREAARLWVGLIGMPSMKKTPTLRAAIAPLHRLDNALVTRFEMENAAIAAMDKKARDSAPRPKQVRHVVGDATVEALQEVLKDSPSGVLSYQDELSGWFGAFDKHSPGKGAAADRGFWLQAFNGGVYNLNRIVRRVSQIPNLSVSLLGGIQPEPIRRIAADSVDDGLLQRFLPVILKPAGVGRDEPIGDALQNYTGLIERLTRMRAPAGAGNLSTGQPIMFSTEARAVRERLEREHFKLAVALESVSPKLAAHFGKHDGIFARLCLIWHCVESNETTPAAEISCDVAERVSLFMADYLRPSAIAFYAGTLGFSAGHEDLMALAAYIVSERLGEVNARVVQRSTGARRTFTADEARRLCEQLQAFGWLDPIEPRQKSNSPRWSVNPQVHEMFAERGRIESARRAAGREAIRAVLSS